MFCSHLGIVTSIARTFVQTVGSPERVRGVMSEFLWVPVSFGKLLSLEKSIVGCLLPNIFLQSFKQKLVIAGFDGVTVIPIGVDMLLHGFESMEVLVESLLKKKSWWSQWFKGFTPWMLTLVYQGCELWLRVKGFRYMCGMNISLSYHVLVRWWTVADLLKYFLEVSEL